jgi:hypothetical protein
MQDSGLSGLLFLVLEISRPNNRQLWWISPIGVIPNIIATKFRYLVGKVEYDIEFDITIFSYSLDNLDQIFPKWFRDN